MLWGGEGLWKEVQCNRASVPGSYQEDGILFREPSMTSNSSGQAGTGLKLVELAEKGL